MLIMPPKKEVTQVFGHHRQTEPLFIVLTSTRASLIPQL
jgi:hypothetical protein